MQGIKITEIVITSAETQFKVSETCFQWIRYKEIMEIILELSQIICRINIEKAQMPRHRSCAVEIKNIENKSRTKKITDNNYSTPKVTLS